MKKQSVRGGVWYIGGRRRRQRQQKRGFLPVGLRTSLAGPFLGSVTQPILKKIVGGKRP